MVLLLLFCLLAAGLQPSAALSSAAEVSSVGRRPVELERAVVNAGPMSVSPSILPPALPLVELFTSQGCSSCPPADRLLASLSATEAAVLAFHVDYWNRIGWNDPFSTARWSQRQADYARRWKSGRIYTPQAVVDGRVEGVGSDERWLRRALEQSRRESRSGLAVEQLGGGGTTVEGGLSVAIEAELQPSAGRDHEVWLAITGSNFETKVESGENARRTLRNDHVVLALERLGRLRAGERRRWNARLAGVAMAHDRAVAFVVAPDPLGVVGARSLSLRPAGTPG
jgi:hypothetical protein